MNINNVATKSASQTQEAVQTDTTAHSFDKTGHPLRSRGNSAAQVNKSEEAGRVKNQNQTAKKEEEASSSVQTMEELTEELNEYMDGLQTNLGFKVKDDMTNQVVVEIKNRKTDELVKQIPSEELLEIKEKMEELTGLLFDQKV